jgi:hypothetical protein
MKFLIKKPLLKRKLFKSGFAQFIFNFYKRYNSSFFYTCQIFFKGGVPMGTGTGGTVGACAPNVPPVPVPIGIHLKRIFQK